MKTFLVLSAVAAVALAAPALYEQTYESHGKTPVHVQEIFRRDRKSTELETKTAWTPSPGSPVNPTLPAPLTGRSITLKKPIIVKKKEGYHVYRDSDEEGADSRETCVKQVKVKLCDDHIVGKNIDMARASTIEDPNILMTEDEMKQNIKLAKEAVENLQRDLKKADKTDDSFKHDNSDTDMELHHDIEVARQALEHIHQNFGNLESMSLVDATVKEAETKSTQQFTIAQTEEERLAQWKEALDNIHRNVEIARNIEDSFKLGEESVPTIVEDIKEEHATMKSAEKFDTDIDGKAMEMFELKDTTGKSAEVETDLVKEDMMTSPTSVSEAKTLLSPDEATVISKNALDEDSQKKVIEDVIEPAKEAEMETMASNHVSHITNAISSDIKDDVKERNTEWEKITDEPENEMAHPPVVMKLDDSAQELLDSHKSAENLSFDKKDAEKLMPHVENPLSEHSKEAVDTTMFVKSTEELPLTTEKDNSIDETKKFEEDHLKQTTLELKDAEENTMPHISELTSEDFKQDVPESDLEMKAVDHSTHHHVHEHNHDEMAQQHMNMHRDIPHNVDPQMRWTQEHNMNMPMAAMKAAEGMPNTHFDHHHHEHVMAQHNHGHLHPHHQRFHEKFVPQGKSADMENMPSNFYMRDSGLAPENHRFRWRPTHEAARAAYGPVPSPASPAYGPAPVPVAGPPSTGAVGVFPNANLGGCGIPLLLSCNPSVVSGSLAKPHSYPASAYRADEDFTFHAKRDVKKTETLKNTLSRTPTSLNTKTATILVSKQ